MVNIDEIMEMFNWNQPEEVQKRGLELARGVKTLNVFLQPYTESGSKCVWDNCAIILAEKTDEELKPYLSELLEWQQDLNWPGAITIQERLTQYKDNEWFDYYFNASLEEAKALKDEMWEIRLLELKEKREAMKRN